MSPCLKLYLSLPRMTLSGEEQQGQEKAQECFGVLLRWRQFWQTVFCRTDSAVSTFLRVTPKSFLRDDQFLRGWSNFSVDDRSFRESNSSATIFSNPRDGGPNFLKMEGRISLRWRAEFPRDGRPMFPPDGRMASFPPRWEGQVPPDGMAKLWPSFLQMAG